MKWLWASSRRSFEKPWTKFRVQTQLKAPNEMVMASSRCSFEKLRTKSRVQTLRNSAPEGRLIPY